MKLFLTILLSLLLLQSVTALHLHTEEDGSGNVTTTDHNTDTSNITLDTNATDINKTEDDEQIQKAQKDYVAIEASGDEELIAAAKEARSAFEFAAEDAKQKAEAAGNLSEDATDQDRQEALVEIQTAKDDLKDALDHLIAKLEDLKSKLEKKQMNAGSQ